MSVFMENYPIFLSIALLGVIIFEQLIFWHYKLHDP